MTTQNINIEVELNDQFFEDILITALEGGSNYWLQSIKVNHPGGPKPKGIPNSIWAAQAINLLSSVECYSDDGEKETLTLGSLTNAVLLWTQNHPDKVEIYNYNGKHSIDAANIDADDADEILQYALFGTLVYG